MPPSNVPETTRAVGKAVAPAELGKTVVRPVPPLLLPPAVVVTARVVVRAVVPARVVVGFPPPEPCTHWEYQSLLYWQVYPDTQVVPPVQPCLGALLVTE